MWLVDSALVHQLTLRPSIVRSQKGEERKVGDKEERVGEQQMEQKLKRIEVGISKEQLPSYEL